MSNKLETLKKQKEEIAAAIAREELIAKNRARVESLTIKILNKHPSVFACDIPKFQKALDDFFAKIEGEFLLQPFGKP